MQIAGLIIGIVTFIMIGILHNAVVTIERKWGSQLWIWFVILGLLLGASSLFADDVLVSSLLGVNGFLFAWFGPELKKQRERVLRDSHK
jgi:TctA family transporter